MMQRHALPRSLLAELSDSLDAVLGLHFPEERLTDLERGVTSAARDLCHGDTEECARRLLSEPLTRSQVEILASHLTVGETYFFREPETLQFFSEEIVPELLRSRRDERPIRIWSAGCCTGEEPYSIAMLLHSLVPEAAAIATIVATDINPRFLRKASEAIYGEWSFRQTPPHLRQRYFHKKGDRRWELDSKIRRMVAFSHLNLATDAYPSLSNNTNALDVIFCRNVLMYFNAERIREVGSKFHNALVEGGWLLVSATETSTTAFPQFQPVQFSGGTAYRKKAEYESPRPFPYETVTTWHPEPAPLIATEPVFSQERPTEPEVEVEVESHDETVVESTRELLDRARVCANDGRLFEAETWCERAIASDRTNPVHHYLLSTVQREVGHDEAAMQSLKRALFLDHDFVLAHFGLANLELSRGRRREARRHFENTLAALHSHSSDEVLPESDGLTAGRLTEIVSSLLRSIR